MNSIKFLLISISLVFLINSCRKDEPFIPSGVESTVYNVVLNDKTVLIDSLEAASLIRMDATNYIFYFKSSEPDIASLQEDDILMIYGVALRRVTKITRDGNETKVETEYATLNEAIREGQIGWNREISFSHGTIPSVRMKGETIQSDLYSPDSSVFNFKSNGFTYKIRFDYSVDKTDVTFRITKDDVDTIPAVFTATGSMDNFFSKTEMEFANGKLKKFRQMNTDMKGDLTIGLKVEESGRDNVSYELPAILFQYPALIGPIPVFINVYALFVINCSVGEAGSSDVEVGFSYQSTTGINFNGSTVTADATMGDPIMVKNQAETVTAGEATAANFGFAFPRIEIRMYDQAIMPWIQTAFLIGGDFSLYPVCQQARSQYLGACYLDLTFLGLEYSQATTLWQEEKMLLQSGSCEQGPVSPVGPLL
jgi:hypothetical protein